MKHLVNENNILTYVPLQYKIGATQRPIRRSPILVLLSSNKLNCGVLMISLLVMIHNMMEFGGVFDLVQYVSH